MRVNFMMSGSEIAVIVFLAIVLGLAVWYFIRFIKSQKKEIKEAEEKANARSKERSERRSNKY